MKSLHWLVGSPQWFEKPDFDLFSVYVEHRRLRPEQPFYILHPEFIWSLWDLIQDNTEDQIQPNPPSSGFTGTSYNTHTTTQNTQ